jgi:uncharacterized repeat protein (TIGR01451 family)
MLRRVRSAPFPRRKLRSTRDGGRPAAARRRRLALLALLALAAPLVASGGQVRAADWPQWGGGAEQLGTAIGEEIVGPGNVTQLAREWDRGFAGAGATPGTPVVDGGLVFVNVDDLAPASISHRLYALDAATGTTAWSAPVSGQTTVPAGAAGRVFIGAWDFGATHATVYGFDASSGAVLWSTPLDGPVSTPTVADDGCVYVAGGSSLHVLDPNDGHKLWSAPLSQPPVAPFRSPFPPAVSDGIAYVWWSQAAGWPFSPASLTAIDVATHDRLWSKDLGSVGSFGAGGVAAVGGAVYASAQAGLSAFDGRTGTFLWGSVHGNAGQRAPVVDLDAGVVIAATQNGFVYAVDAFTGQPIWSKQQIGLRDTHPAGPVVANGVVYVSGNSSDIFASSARLVALDEDDGSVLWTAGGGGDRPAIAGGVLHRSSGNRLEALTLPHDDADLSVTTVRSHGSVGSLVYTLRVQNAGPTMAYDVWVDDTVPAGATLVAASASQGRCGPEPPRPPALEAPVAGATGTSLVWSPPASDGGSPVTGYRIYRGTESGGATLLATIGAVRSYTDTSNALGDDAYYQVAAVNAVGEGLRSNERHVPAPAAPFQPYEDKQAGSAFSLAAATGDVTGDGRNDAVVTTGAYDNPATDRHVLVFAQTPGGGLAAPVGYLAAGPGETPTSVAVGDITGDGRADVVVGVRGLGVKVFPQLPSGVLGEPTTTPTVDDALVRLGHLDVDGRLDVVAVGRATNTAAVLLNDGSGGLRAPVTYPVAQAESTDLEVADVTGDGLDDVVVSVAGFGPGVIVLPQLETGGLGKPDGYDVDAYSIGVGDLTSDGRVDVVVRSLNAVEVLAQTPAGTLAAPIGYPSYASFTAVEVADVDRDGRDDAVTFNGAPTAGVFLQQPSGQLGSEDRYPIPSDAHPILPHGLALGDVSGDGSPDIVFAASYHTLVVLRNNAQRTPPSTLPGAPVLDSATPGGGGVTLNWSPPGSTGGSALLGYRIHRRVSGGPKALLTVVGPVTSFVDTSVAPGMTYDYELTALNPLGEGPPSNGRSAVTPGPPATPSRVACALGQIGAGADVLVTVEVNAPSARTYTNRAVVSSTGDGDPSNDVSELTHADGPPVAGPPALVFVSERDGNAELYRSGASGAPASNVSRSPYDEFSGQWSPDGTKLVFDAVVAGNNDVYVMSRDGTNLKRLTHSIAVDENPSWSPDGTRIVFDSSRDAGFYEIWQMNADGSGVTRLTDSGIDLMPSYSPDGTAIAFVSGRDGDWEIYGMNADGSDQRSLSRHPDDDFSPPAWSPDGSRIAFASLRDGDWEIYSMAADGSSQTNLTHDPGADVDPAWSPDGSKIAFASDRAGQFGVYVSADGSSPTHVTEGQPGPNRDPAWAPTTLGAVAPSAPTDAAAVGGDGSAIVSFSAPASDGGSAILYYTVTASPGGQGANGAGSPIVVAGLENGTSYAFTVTATNAFGTSPPSWPSLPVVPSSHPRPHPDPPAASARPAVPGSVAPTAPRPKPPGG